MVTHAGQGGNEIVVAGRGSIYINGAHFNSQVVRRPSPATSSTSRQMANYARSLTTSNSPTAWSSRPTTER
jgi:hypothetical protein